MYLPQRTEKVWYWDTHKEKPVRRWVKRVSQNNQGYWWITVKHKLAETTFGPEEVFSTEEECWEAHAASLLAR